MVYSSLCLAVALATIVNASPVSVAINKYEGTDAANWAGILDYPNYASKVPLNVTLSGDGASFAWVYDKDAGGHYCTPDQETSLKVTVSGSTFTFMGTGKDPSYYSFQGTKSTSTPPTITGTMHNPGSNGALGSKVGTFTITADAAQKASTCKAPPGPPPPGPPTPTHSPYIWPLPQQYTNGTQSVAVTPSSSFFVVSGTSDFLTQAFARYTALTFPHIAAPSTRDTGVTKLQVTVASMDDSFPQLGTDENYTLDVTDSSATLTANTVYGVLRGLETFSQLVTFDFDSQSYVINSSPWHITDFPRFPHRGLMIDTARHFETLSSIRIMIDSLPYAKINVLHWHMSDSQSFPLQSKSAPKLWSDAWSSVEQYTQMDVASIVEYAKMRGVRVMVEFDMPGHAGSWCKGYPEICPSATCTQPLNVANNKTFEIIEGLMKECTGNVASKPGNPSPGLFKDNFIHLGGDEVNTACWSSTPSVAAWLAKNNMTPDQGYAYFVKKVADMAIAQGHRPVQWSEVFDHFKYNLTKQTIVHIWKSVTNVTEVLAGGYNVLLNVGYDKLSWYLDNLNVEWDAVYMNEPCTGVPDDLCPLILGGHGEMWGETVDASDIQQTVWPRLGAIAERLWSARSVNSVADAHQRIEGFRCLLNRRGVAAAPVNNAEARSSPPGPGSCLQQ